MSYQRSMARWNKMKKEEKTAAYKKGIGLMMKEEKTAAYKKASDQIDDKRGEDCSVREGLQNKLMTKE